MARRNLSRNIVRSGLAALGIVIGVVAIAGIGIAGVALQESATEDLGGLANEVSVMPGEDHDSDTLSERETREIERAIAGIDADVVRVRQHDDTGTVTYQGEEYDASIEGMDNPGASYDAAAGDIPETFQSGVLVGNSFADETNIGVGETVRIDGISYHVRAILEAEEVGGFQRQYTMVVPIDEIDTTGYDSVSILAADSEQTETIVTQIEEQLNDREKIVNVQSMGALQDTISSFYGSISSILLGIGAISLVVSSVSILNVMLMSTIERREEIGVLRAVGVPKGGVLGMVLTEATLLGVIGGIIGAGLAAIVGLVLYDVLFSNPLRVIQTQNVQYVVAGFGFAVLSSVLSGLYPAWKAAGERPVDALRE